MPAGEPGSAGGPGPESQLHRPIIAARVGVGADDGLDAKAGMARLVGARSRPLDL